MQVYTGYAAETAEDLILEKQVEIYRNEPMSTEDTLNQSIFLTLWFIITSHLTIHLTSKTRA